MDIKQLEYFITIVYENFNLTKASEKLKISQPALSKMIISFENEMGLLLFNRERGRLSSLSDAGKLLLEYAHPLVTKHREMMEKITQYSSKK